MRASENQSTQPDLIEGLAKVVKVLGPTAWLEPEQTASCGSCSASSACGAKGMGTLASRIESRAFTLDNEVGLLVGERVVVGVREGSLVKGALIAYGLPLTTMWIVAATVQALYDHDGITMVAMFASLAIGLGFARLMAARLFAQGRTRLHFLRRVSVGSAGLPWPVRSDR